MLSNCNQYKKHSCELRLIRMLYRYKDHTCKICLVRILYRYTTHAFVPDVQVGDVQTSRLLLVQAAAYTDRP
jgi:hypothetical protein